MQCCCVLRSYADVCGTTIYMAPEIIRGVPYDFGVDAWAIGVVAFELLSGVQPFSGRNTHRIEERILSKPLRFDRTVWANVSSSAADFCARLLQRSPPDRMPINIGERCVHCAVMFCFRAQFIPRLFVY